MLLTLYLINSASLLLLSSCPVEKVIPSNSEQKADNQHNDEFCPTQKGIVSAGLQQVGEFFSPEAWTAWATLVMAVFTGVLSIVAYQQIQLARSEFLATHRPLLRVRYFKYTGSTETDLQVTFTVVNVGKTTAHLLGSSVQIAFFGDSPPTPVYVNGQNVTRRRKLEPGASDEYGIDRKTKRPDHLWLYVYGYLMYADDVGNTRTTAFCRKYLAGRDRFITVDDPDYEYED